MSAKCWFALGLWVMLAALWLWVVSAMLLVAR